MWCSLGVHFVLVDCKAVPLRLALDRAAAAGLDNVTTLQVVSTSTTTLIASISTLLASIGTLNAIIGTLITIIRTVVAIIPGLMTVDDGAPQPKWRLYRLP